MELGLNRLSANAVKALEQYAKRILDNHKAYNELRYKAETIDVAYYRYQTDSDREAGNTTCGVSVDNLIVPVVISQVDSFIGYLGEVYLSGYPIFPIVSTPSTVKVATKMEAMVDTHATIGGYARELLKAFKQGMKYNFTPTLSEWRDMPSYNIVAQALNTQASKKIEASKKGYTCFKSLDAYNTIWDNRFTPADVSSRGDFIGYIEQISRTELKALLLDLQEDKAHYNSDKLSTLPAVGVTSIYYTVPPQVSQYVSQRGGSRTGTAPDWDVWFGDTAGTSKGSLTRSMYELTHLFVRIIPSDFGISVPSPNSPQMFKLYFLNAQLLIGFERVITPYNRFPIEIGTPLEDQFGLQTPSIAESQGGWQAAASTLFQIRINAARRAVSDRGIFDADLINPSDINSSHPAAKIPARLKGLQDKKLSDAYYQIPFDSRGLETVIGDMGDIMRYADLTSGLNAPQRGQFQKGNKSVDEWRDTMGSADNRLRLPALNIEFQSLIPLKEAIKFNIFMHGEAGTYTNMKSGEYLDVKPEDIDEMQQKAMAFKIADGYTPKSKMASTDFLVSLLQTIMSSEPLMMRYGPALPSMVAHIAQLGGVGDLDQYSPEVSQVTGAPNGQPAAPQPGVPGQPGGQPIAAS